MVEKVQDEHLKHNQKSEIMIYFSTTFYFDNKKMKNPNAGNSLTWYLSNISGVALKSIPVMMRLTWPSSSSTEAGFFDRISIIYAASAIIVITVGSWLLYKTAKRYLFSAYSYWVSEE